MEYFILSLSQGSLLWTYQLCPYHVFNTFATMGADCFVYQIIQIIFITSHYLRLKELVCFK